MVHECKKNYPRLGSTLQLDYLALVLILRFAVDGPPAPADIAATDSADRGTLQVSVKLRAQMFRCNESNYTNETCRCHTCKGGDGEEAVDDQGLGGE